MVDSLITIIVPVYKVEKYIDKCVQSIVSQTHTNLEIILVVDGSPDRCAEICDDWAKKDTRIKVIHQNNTGGGQARNVGLELAQGDFIAFVDSDDYISPQMYEYLIGLFCEDIDIVECDFITVWDNNVQFDTADTLSNVTTYSCIGAMSENIADHYFRQLIWNKLYRKEVIGSIRFPAGKKIDDEFWTYQVIGNAKRLLHSDKRMYAYRQQIESVMHSIDAKKRLQAIDAKCERHKYIIEKVPNLKCDSCYNLWFTCIYQGQLALRELKNDDKKDVFIYLKSVIQKYPLEFGKGVKLPMVQKLWLRMANIAFYRTCQVRNLLKIGL